MSDQVAADVQAAASTGFAAITWLADLAFALQVIATIVAIVAGLGAAWFHFEKALAARRARRERD